MRSLSLDAHVADLVTDDPARARIFEQLRINYCCGGGQSLADACRKQNLDPETVLRMLDAAAQPTSDDGGIDWSKKSLHDLIDHITSTHHDYLRRELPRLSQLWSQVAHAHGSEYSWVERVRDLFQSLKTDLDRHMQSEEEYVFPAIRTLANGRVLPDGSTLEPSVLEEMKSDHDEAGSALARLRELTNEYTPPEGACPKFRAAIDGLRELEADMHRHVHKENNILFPRARSLA